MEISGTIKKILPLKGVTTKAGNEWKKRDVIITQLDEYAKDVCITAFGDKSVQSISRFIIGDTVDVKVNVESREFNGKYYTNLNGYWWANKNSHNEEINKSVKEELNGRIEMDAKDQKFVTTDDDDLPF